MAEKKRQTASADLYDILYVDKEGNNKKTVPTGWFELGSGKYSRRYKVRIVTRKVTKASKAGNISRYFAMIEQVEND